MLLSNLSLVALMAVGSAYLLIDIARVKLPGSTYTVTVQYDRSGGLQAGNDVTWRGYRVGSVESVEIIDGGSGIAAVTEIEEKYRIPSDTEIKIAALSGAGEQYIDFRPNTDSGPYLADGDVIRFDPQHMSSPTPIWEALANSDDLFAQIDPAKFEVILNELDIALSGGQDQLRALIDGASLAMAGLDDRLPQTVNLLENLQVISDTTTMAQPDLGTLTRNSRILMDQLNAANAELRELLDRAPGQLALADQVLERNMDPIQLLLNNFAAIVKAAQLRTPAIRALFPSLVPGTYAMGVPAHDNEFYTVVDIWPRPFCRYSTMPSAWFVVQDGTFGRWNYCTNPPADQQIRGSSNAPRPNVPDNGAQMPTGVDPNERTLPPVR
ncbi:MCE family protein [Nocardia sp. 2]|uniref:MCE family protein n=2 Tax=Nocardia acididurans TaxID=2802282 RepID=A0ABS1M231_9NOCA|nr:MCE family protein [Nocardia acididurans]